MDEQGRHFLAGAALAQDEYRNVGARHKPALGFDLLHALAGPDKGCVLIQRDFLELCVVVGRLPVSILEALRHSQIDVGFSERLEDHVRGAHAGGRHNLLQLG